jgi:lipid-A-disaccharide synthase-like uncharacterized protein
MNRRLMLLLEVVILVGALAWVGVLIVRSGHHDGEPPGVVIKVPLEGAEDRALLVREKDGSFSYRITTDEGQEQTLTAAEFSERVYRDQSSRGFFESLFNVSTPMGFVWVALGFIGQVLFTGRMIVQWIASEKSRRSVVPPVFWWMSVSGASMLLIYFIWRQDAVGVLGQATGWVIYVRNLLLIYRPATPPPSVGADPGPEPELLK